MTSEERADKAEAKLEAVRKWAARKHMAWLLKNEPMTDRDWNDLREALGIERVGP